MAWNFSFLAPDNVRSRLVGHMGGDCVSAHIISHTIEPLEQVNLQLVLDQWLQKEGGSLFGYSLSGYTFETGLAHFLRTPEAIAPVEREYAEAGPGRQRSATPTSTRRPKSWSCSAAI